MIYFDNSATTLQKPAEVGQAVCSAINSFGGASRSAHSAAMKANRAIFGAREKMGCLFAINPMQVAFTSNATESLNIAIGGLFKAGDHVITTALEHNSVLRPLFHLEKQGLQLTVLPADAKGNIDYEDFQAHLQTNTKGIVCTHASNVTGNMLDIEYISTFTKKNGLLFVLDASQTAGMMDIDMALDGVDVLCFTGHKSLYGPQGTGGLCVRDGLQIDPLKSGGSGTDSFSRMHPKAMPDVLEAGTPNAHGIAGLWAALDYIERVGVSVIREKTCEMARMFYDEVLKINGVRVYGDFDCVLRAPIVTLNVGDFDSAQVAGILNDEYEICVRAGAHCAPLLHKALGTEKRGAVRFSFSHYNTEEELKVGIRAIKELAK